MMAADAMAYIAKPSNLTPTIKWEITDDGVLRIYGTGEMPDFGIWDKPKFWRQKKYFPHKIKRIEIGEGITKIGFKAFYHTNEGKLHNVPIKLPSTIKKLSLSDVVMEDSRIPDGVEELNGISDVKFPHGKMIVPASVKKLESYCFPKQVSEIVIEGCPILEHGNFFALENTHTETRVVFKDPNINLKPLAGRPSDGYTGIKMKDKWKVKLILPKGCEIPQKMEEVKDHYTIVSPEILAAQQAEKNVNGYIANRLEPWNEFLGKKKMPSLVTEYNAKAGIKFSMEQWQKKGEYETTAEYEARVNEKTRKEMLAKFTAEWNKKAKDAVEAYNKEAIKYKKEYESKRESLRKEFYVNLAKKAIVEYRNDEYSLKSSYDADNETFLINTKNHGDILLKVPRADAPGFKQNWNSIVSKMDFAFLPDSETSVGLSRIIFPYNGKEYSYDGKTQTAYKVPDPDYAFTPLEVTGLKLQDVEVAALEAPSQTVRVLTQQNSSSVKKPNQLISDIDQNIPEGSVRRDKTFAFLIANENYSRTDPVTFALNDGESMRKYCEKTLGIPAKNISYIRNASLNDMRYQLKRISDICSAFGDEASVIVYYAGHGVPDEVSSDSYLLPVDGYAENVNTGLSLKEVIETLSGLPASNVTLLLDACFSGTGREGKALYASRGVALKPKTVAPKGNLVIFSASQGVESALPYKEKQHGLFTYYLLKKLKESKGQVNLGNLAEYVIENVKRTSVVEGKMQTPTINASIEKSDWREIKF